MKKHLIKQASSEEPTKILFDYLKESIKNDDWFLNAEVTIKERQIQTNNEFEFHINNSGRWSFNN